MYQKEYVQIVTIKPDTDFTSSLESQYAEHGGAPIVVGVVRVTITPGTIEANQRLRYKVQFPDGHVDYFNFEKFDQFFAFADQA